MRPILAHIFSHRSRNIKYAPQEPRPPSNLVHPRVPARIHPHAHHDAAPDEVEDGDHEEKDVGEAPLVGFAGLAGAVRVDVGGGEYGALAGGFGSVEGVVRVDEAWGGAVCSRGFVLEGDV